MPGIFLSKILIYWKITLFSISYLGLSILFLIMTNLEILQKKKKDQIEIYILTQSILIKISYQNAIKFRCLLCFWGQPKSTSSESTGTSTTTSLATPPSSSASSTSSKASTHLRNLSRIATTTGSTPTSASSQLWEALLCCWNSTHGSSSWGGRSQRERPPQMSTMESTGLMGIHSRRRKLHFLPFRYLGFAYFVIWFCSLYILFTWSLGVFRVPQMVGFQFWDILWRDIGEDTLYLFFFIFVYYLNIYTFTLSTFLEV